MQIKHNQIILWKGFKWANLLKLDKYNISRALIQLVTLSRYTHTAIYYQFLEKEYLIQSNLISGMHIIEVTGETWFKSNIKDNVWDLYEYRFQHRKMSDYERFIRDKVMQMYNDNKKSLNLGSYSLIGLLNQFCLNVFNKSFLTRTKLFKMFCSEMTHYYFTDCEESFTYSPHSITDSDLYKKIK